MQKHVHECSLATLFLAAESGGTPNVHLLRMDKKMSLSHTTGC
jgi:hypothetical protein